MGEIRAFTEVVKWKKWDNKGAKAEDGSIEPGGDQEYD